MDGPQPGGGNGWSALLRRARAAGLHTNMEMVEPGAGPHHRGRPALPALPGQHRDQRAGGRRADRHRRSGARRGRPGGLAGAGGDGARPDRARRLGARGGALPGGLRRRRPGRPDLAAGLGPAAAASRSAAPSARATPSPPASSSACTTAGRSSAACGWRSPPPRRPCAARTPPTASSPQISASPRPTGPATARRRRFSRCTDAARSCLGDEVAFRTELAVRAVEHLSKSGALWTSACCWSRTTRRSVRSCLSG